MENFKTQFICELQIANIFLIMKRVVDHSIMLQATVQEFSKICFYCITNFNSERGKKDGE